MSRRRRKKKQTERKTSAHTQADRIDHLLRTLREGKDAAREEAFDHLMEDARELGPGAAGRLVDALASENLNVRLSVSAALSHVPTMTPDDAARLALSLRDADPTVRGNVAQALGRLGTAARDLSNQLDLALQTEEDDWAGAIMLEAVGRLEPAPKP